MENIDIRKCKEHQFSIKIRIRDMNKNIIVCFIFAFKLTICIILYYIIYPIQITLEFQYKLFYIDTSNLKFSFTN